MKTQITYFENSTLCGKNLAQMSETSIFVAADGGCVRLRVDGGAEILFGNGYGDGAHRVSFGRTSHPTEWLGLLQVTVYDKLEIATYDCDEFVAAKTLPAGTYFVAKNRSGNGHVRIAETSPEPLSRAESARHNALEAAITDLSEIARWSAKRKVRAIAAGAAQHLRAAGLAAV